MSNGLYQSDNLGYAMIVRHQNELKISDVLCKKLEVEASISFSEDLEEARRQEGCFF